MMRRSDETLMRDLWDGVYVNEMLWRRTGGLMGSKAPGPRWGRGRGDEA